MIPNFLPITSPSYIPYPSGSEFDLIQYNPRRVLRQFEFDQDVLDQCHSMSLEWCNEDVGSWYNDGVLGQQGGEGLGSK